MNALNGHINISTHHATQNDEYYTVEVIANCHAQLSVHFVKIK